MTTKSMDDLIEVMRRLRDPDGGCPWDIEQTFATIAPYTIEEAYEVADAIANGSREDLKDELGDLLLQVVYHSRMAEEEGSFAFEDVARAITEKMIRRHPHVFGDEKVAEEYGDLLFSVAVLGQHLRVDAEQALIAANHKFERRFRGVEDRLRAVGKTPSQSTLNEMDVLWDEVKVAEKTGT